MDWNVTAIIAMVSGTLLGYVGKVWQWVYWTAKLPLDNMYMLTAYNFDNNGMDIKFSEDRVDHLNPSQDSGILINSSWMLTYEIKTESDTPTFSLFGGSSTSNRTYSVSCLRIFRKKVLDILNKSLTGKSKERMNKIFIQETDATIFAGNIDETHLYIPKVIKDRLNGDRTTRLNILLHGEIGTGKTTIARAIAQTQNIPIYIIEIRSYWGVTDFIKALQRIPDDAIILFDDIDLTLNHLMRKDNDGKTIASSGMGAAAIMAFLDGIYMKHKRWIVIMCTNYPEVVRKGLRLRPGRVHIDYECTQKHVSNYIEAVQKPKEDEE